MESRKRNAFTLIEILIVVVIMAVLAATIIPQFTDSTEDAKQSTALFNLNTLRGTIQLYKTQHSGTLPDAAFAKLLARTTKAGEISSSGEILPYFSAIPENPISGSTAIKTITTDAPASSDVTADDAGGWIYSTATGGVWLDHSELYTK